MYTPLSLIKKCVRKLAYSTSPYFFVEMRGGLGNQLFQLCFALYIIKKNKKVLLDTTYYAQNTPGDTPRTLEPKISNHFKTIHVPKVLKKIFKSLKLITLENGMNFNQKYLEAINDSLYFSGYWQSFKYTDAVRKELISFLDIDFAHSKIAVHIRRGDYVTNKNAATFHGTLDLSYYYEALIHLRTQSSVTDVEVYSDDPDWVKENFKIDGFTIKIVTPGEPLSDLKKMAKCSYFVIANSTYSWWAAYLSQADNKIVIAPKKWFNNEQTSAADLIPDNWQRR